jgi:NADPH:quinone reductase-like Zn-dependent oxidoreductase
LKYPACTDILRSRFFVNRSQPFSSFLTFLILSQLQPGIFLRLSASESDDLRFQQAFTRTEYGGPEVLGLEEVTMPIVKEGHILVKVKANSANPADWHIIRGKPFFARFTFGLFKPNDGIPGADFAGIVEEVGNKVTRFKEGDSVFGETLDGGAFAEYICAAESVCAVMPEAADFSLMACVPIAGLTALQALITHWQLREGETVLINGSSGGVGHFAVQIAKAYGASVTAVCSGKNADFVGH